MTTPVPVYHFSVDWGGTRMGFTRVKGLEARTDPIEYREGSFASDDVVSIPGLKLNDNVVLSRGVIPSDNDFFDWYATVRSGTARRDDIAARWRTHAGHGLETEECLARIGRRTGARCHAERNCNRISRDCA